MRVIFLSLAANTKEHEDNRKAQESTSFAELPPNTQIFYMYGRPDLGDIQIEGNSILLPTPEEYLGMLRKTILAVDFLHKKFNPDFIVRINTSNYFDVCRVRKLLSECADELSRCPGGLVGEIDNPLDSIEPAIKYIGGAGIYLHRNMYLKLLEIDIAKYSRIVDDVAIGHFFHSLRIEPMSLLRCDVTDSAAVFPTYQTRLKAWHSNQITQNRFFEIHRIYSARNRFQESYYFVIFSLLEIKRALRIRKFRQALNIFLNIFKFHTYDFKSSI